MEVEVQLQEGRYRYSYKKGGRGLATRGEERYSYKKGCRGIATRREVEV